MKKLSFQTTSPSATLFDEATLKHEHEHEHIITNNKTFQNKQNNKFKSPKSPTPLRKQISVDFKDIYSVIILFFCYA